MNKGIYPNIMISRGLEGTITFGELFESRRKNEMFYAQLGCKKGKVILPTEFWNMDIIYIGDKVEVYFCKYDGIPKKPIGVFSCEDSILLLRKLIPLELLIMLAHC